MKSSTNGGAATDVASWLKTLPLAPEYHPTPLEFQDPIAYILKIEKEASQFGICKIIPPLPTASKKSTVSNLNHSFAARNPDDSPTFTTRQQQIGFCPRRPRPVQKPVWQSGERYTLTQFESKAKQFEREQLKKIGKKSFTPLEVETLFWRACAGKPFSVEYANDIPGSGFPPIGGDGSKEAGNVGESGWNMRTVSRARCSLLRFMKDDIPGVTSPMVYVGMMFSWFAWHVEDHDLHSLNYLHMGAGKTWYGVPRDACSAFEDVIRVQGYCEEVNPLVTFAILGEKTTVISPEVLIGAGIPCCRLVQNAGEFVVTFPGSYHSGFSHGFNCGEASNIATPEWLKVAKEAAVKRASTNYPPMVSHFQLLYALAVSLCSRMPMDICNEPRSSRLKYKMKGEGEAIVKGLFVENVIQNNNLLALLLDKGSSCIVLPQNTSNSHLGSGPLARSLMTVKPRLSLGLCSRQEAVEASEVLFSNYAIPERNGGIRQLAGFYPVKVNPISVCQEKKLLSTKCSKFGNVNFHPSNMENMEGGKGSTFQGDGLLDKGLLSCATCGILSFACVAVIQPREAAARYLMSADCSVFNDSVIDSGEINDFCISNMFSVPEHMESHVQSRSDGNLADCNTESIEASAQNAQLVADSATQKGISALDLLASAYGDYSDSEEEELFEMPACSDDKDSRDTAHSGQPCSISLPNICSSNIVPSETDSHLVEVDCQNVVTGSSGIPSKLVSDSTVPTKISCLLDVAANLRNLASISTEEKQLEMKFLAGNLPGNPGRNPELAMVNNLDADTKMGLSSLTHSAKDRHSFDGSSTEPDSTCHSTEISDTSETKMANPVSGSAGFLISSGSCCDSDSPTGITAIVTQDFNFDTSVKNSSISVLQRSNKDSSRMHVFCLEHAVEVERQLHPVGGVHILLVCHPGYPKIEAEAKVLAKELGVGHFWKDIPYQEATEEDQRTIQSALQDEEAVPMKGDWSVKLGINLYYSANLSKSPIYSKQLPYNLVIYKAFGRNSTGSSLGKQRGLSRRRRIAVAGRWCGKVWMSNQVHPYLAHRNDIQSEDDEHDTDQKLLAETDNELTDFVSSPRRNLSNSTESGRKRKRKTVLLKLSDKRPKFGNLDSSDCIAEVSEFFSPQGGRVSSKQAAGRNSTSEEVKDKPALRKPVVSKRTNKVQATVRVHEDEDPEYQCDMEGRSMSFESKRTKKVQPITRVYEDEDTAYQCDMEGRSMSFGLKRIKKGQRTTRVHEDEDTEYQSDIEGRSMSFGSKKTKKVQPTTRVHEDEDTEYQCDIEGRSMSFGSKKTKKIQPTTRVHEDEDTEYQCDIEGRSMSFGSKKTKKVQSTTRVHEEDAEYPCDMEGCSMSFGSKKDLVLHKRNICPEKDCRKKFFSHKYLVQHRKVHMDDRPLKCPWKGCKMAFKWPWARTEHIRVHTGDRPYICQEPGCDQTFRFVSDFSRHKRKTGHSAKKVRR